MLRRYGCRGLQYRPGILIFDGTLYGRGAYTETAMTKKLTFALLALGLLACAPRPAGPVDYVDPFIGTGYHGHTYPGATTPFGMVQLSPDTRAGDWDACAGYHYDDTTIDGFFAYAPQRYGVCRPGRHPVPSHHARNRVARRRLRPAALFLFRTGTRRPPAAIMPWSYPVKISGWSLRRRPVRACTAIPLRARGRGRWSST